MDVMLVSVAIASIVLACAMGAVLFKVLKEERRRSDARVALLLSLIHISEPTRPY